MTAKLNRQPDIRRITKLNGHMNGLRVEVLRQSKVTGAYVVKLLEGSPAAPAYKVGTEISLYGYEMKDDEPMDIQDEADPAGRITAAIERAKSES